MKVRMLKDVAGHQAADIADVFPEVAVRWINAGIAEPENSDAKPTSIVTADPDVEVLGAPPPTAGRVMGVTGDHPNAYARRRGRKNL